MIYKILPKYSLFMLWLEGRRFMWIFPLSMGRRRRTIFIKGSGFVQRGFGISLWSPRRFSASGLLPPAPLKCPGMGPYPFLKLPLGFTGDAVSPSISGDFSLSSFLLYLGSLPFSIFPFFLWILAGALPAVPGSGGQRIRRKVPPIAR